MKDNPTDKRIQESIKLLDYYRKQSQAAGIEQVRQKVINNTGSTIDKGKAVYVSGYDTTAILSEVTEADSSASNALPALGLMEVDIINGGKKRVVVIGPLSGIDTSAFTENDALYVSTSGDLTATAPSTHPQQIATCTFSDATNGIVFVNGAGLDCEVYLGKTGWPETTGVTLSFDNGTLTFTVTDGGSAYYYIKGKRYVLGGNKTVTITDTEGTWYIYFSGATLTASQTPWVITDDDKALVAYVLWDAANNEGIFVGYELHGYVMDAATHARMHHAGGAAWDSGLLVSDAGAEVVNVSAGDFHDEDIEIDITDGAGGGLWEQVLSPAEIPIYYLDGASLWRLYDTGDKANADDVGYVDGSLDLHYNKLNGAWASTAMAVNKYVAYWIVASNELNAPVMAIMGQRIDNTFAAAKDNNLFSGLSFATAPVQEIVILARCILKSTAGGLGYTLEEITDLRAFNAQGNVTSPLITDHGGLGGLDDDDHINVYMLLAASSTDNAVIRWDGVGGRTPQDSAVLIDDTGNITLPDGATLGQAAGPLMTFDDAGNTLDIDGCDVTIVAGSLGVGIAGAADAPLRIEDATVDTTVTYYGIQNTHKKTAGVTTEADDFFGLHNTVELDHNGSTIGYLTGIYNETILSDGTVGDDVEDCEGIYNIIKVSGGITADHVIGTTNLLDLNTGTIGDDVIGGLDHVDIEAGMTSIGGSVYGRYIQVDADKDPTGSVYMLYLKEATGIDYGIYQDGSADNYLEGDLQLNGGNLEVKSQGEVRFFDNGNYVGFEAPALTGDQIWVLPDADGNANEVMETDGAGNLSWVAVASNIEAGTGAGQILYWDTDTWKHTEVTEIVWDDTNKVLLISDGSDADPALTFTADDNTGIRRTANDAVGIVGGGSTIADHTRGRHTFSIVQDQATGHIFIFNRPAAHGMTGTAEQAWMSLDAEANQSGVANYVGILLDVTETTLGSAQNYLIDLRVGGTSKFNVESDGDVNVVGNLHLATSNTELRFYEGVNYVGFEAPALAADQIWVLPDADGNANEVMETDGGGNLTWVANPDTWADTVFNVGSTRTRVGSGATSLASYHLEAGQTNAIMAYFIFEGTTQQHAATTNEFTVYGDTTGGDVPVEIYDMTNTNQIATVTVTAAGPGFYSSTTFNNVPAGQALMAIRATTMGVAPGPAETLTIAAMSWARSK